mmetsp:Transcript_34/g.79  ORF Transcript_34/g.79 Transcript_34/m.79 type:complete len:226 (+) Transcript_34:320-997(+)
MGPWVSCCWTPRTAVRSGSFPTRPTCAAPWRWWYAPSSSASPGHCSWLGPTRSARSVRWQQWHGQLGVAPGWDGTAHERLSSQGGGTTTCSYARMMSTPSPRQQRRRTLHPPPPPPPLPPSLPRRLLFFLPMRDLSRKPTPPRLRPPPPSPWRFLRRTQWRQHGPLIGRRSPAQLHTANQWRGKRQLGQGQQQGQEGQGEGGVPPAACALCPWAAAHSTRQWSGC